MLKKLSKISASNNIMMFVCATNMQKLGGNAMLVDAEHAFDPSYSRALGVDIENLIVCQPDNGEMALESNSFIPLVSVQLLKDANCLLFEVSMYFILLLLSV